MNKFANRSTESQVAIVWDGQNCRGTEGQVDCLGLFARSMGSTVFQKFYSDFQLETNRNFADTLYLSGFELINVPSFKNKPNRTDQKMIQDCESQILNNSAIRTVILLSGDGDFTKLVRVLKERGKKVVVVSSNLNGTNPKLMSAADEFHLISQIESSFRSLPFAA